jgi:hypothetical protein
LYLGFDPANAATSKIDRSTTYVVMQFHTNANIVKSLGIPTRLCRLGFQFERLVTGKGFMDQHNPASSSASYSDATFRCLFGRDAVDKAESVVEIKASNPKM